MRIAVLSFGSLVNQPYSPVYDAELKAHKPAGESQISNGNYNIKPDSPFVPAKNLELPIRLARISNEGTPNRRITAVLCPGASGEKVFVAESNFTNLNDAIKNLREREGISAENYKSIGYVNLNNGTKRSKLENVAAKVSEWAERSGYDAVVWTDLPPKGIAFQTNSTGREILPFLENDSTLLKNTQNYIQQLPTQHNSLQNKILEMQQAPSSSIRENDYQASLTADFAIRDTMPQTNTPKTDWFKPAWGTWGPYSKAFPAPKVPEGVDPVQWKRDRIIEVAKHYKGLPYKRSDEMRGHFPARNCGLDCSNFASWVYNYGLGIQFSSSVDELVAGVDSDSSGRKIDRNAPLKKGDLLFFKGDPKHVVIYIDENHIIDSTSGQRNGVDVRDLRNPINSWCRPVTSNPRFLFARRPIE